MAEEENQNKQRKKRDYRIKQAKEKFTGTIKFSTIFFLIINIAMIIVGAINLNNCPAEPEIPILLVGLGVIGVVFKALRLFKNIIIRRLKLIPLLSVLFTCEVLLVVLESYYTYKEYEPNYDPTNEKYCNKTLYLFSFIYVTIFYVILLLFMMGVGCFVAGLLVLDRYGVVEEDVEGGDSSTISPLSQATDKNKMPSS